MDTLDPQVVNLAKAIRNTESGGDFQAQGKSGEYGGYQYTPDTWAKDSADAGVNVPLQQATPQQQNEVAYKKILSLKNQGYNPGQIASIWNSGKPDWQGNVGTNKYGVHFDTPQYVDSVTKYYQQLKAGQQNPAVIPNPSTVEIPTVDSVSQPDFLQKLGNFINMIFPGGKIGEAIGTEIAKAKATPEEKQYITPGPSTSQVIGDIGQAALTIGLPGVGEGESLVGRLLANTALGAGLGGFNAMANKQNIGQGALLGAGGGLAAGTIGETIGNILGKVLPKRLYQNVLRGANEETIQQAMKKPAFTFSGLQEENQKAWNSLDTQIKDILAKPETALPEGAGVMVGPNLGQGAQSLENTLSKFSDSDMKTIQDVATEVKSVVPEKSKLVDKVMSGEATLSEKNELRSYIDRNVYGIRGELPKLSFSKNVANDVANNLRNEVQTLKPETAPLFDEFSKEIQLKKFIGKNAKRLAQGKAISVLGLAQMLGAGIMGLPGYLGATALQEGLKNPTADITAARFLRGGTKTVGTAIKGLLPNILNASSNY